MLAALGALVERFGLPLMLGAGLAWALFTRRLTLGSETNYVEARRLEERQGRLDAEGALRTALGALTGLTESVEDLTEAILAEPSPPPTPAERRRVSRRS